MIKFLFATDSHGNKICPEARDKVLEFAENWNPDVIIHGGDAFDLVSLRKGASPEEKAELLVDDIEEGLTFLQDYFRGKRKKNVMLLGNHDFRLWDNVGSNNGIVAEYSQLMVARIEKFFKSKKIEWYPYDVRKGIFTLGKLNFIHGFKCGMNVAKDVAIDYGNCVQGHVHRFSTFTTSQFNPAVGMTIGCLARTDMDYLYKSVASLAHQNGFAYGVVDEKTGDFDIWPVKRLSNGIWSNPFDYIK